jgi:hypothetical protein
MANGSIRSKANLVEWRKSPTTRLVSAMHLPEAADHWLNVIERVGMPSVPSAQSARDEAIVLLQVGAEVEHALLLQYLFAAYSVNPAVLIDTAHPELGTWQKTLVAIAKQEMAHLITVQNLLLALGAGMHFDREDFPLHPSLYPFPVVLEPLSEQSLAKYVAAEMPPLSAIDAAKRDHVAEILKEADVAAHEDVQRVGMIYAHVYWLFRKTDDADANEPWKNLLKDPSFSPWHIADEDFAPPEALTNSSNSAEWGVTDDDGSGMHIDLVASGDPAARRLSALQAIFTIAAQGEGPVTQHDSHFERFLKLFDSFKALPTSAVLRVATNPSTTSDPQAGGAPESRHQITEPTSLKFAKLLDVRYEFLLICLMRGVQEPQGSPTRSDLVSWAVGEMTQCISAIAMKLAASPLAPAAPGTGVSLNAGAPFELLHGPLPQEPLTQWVRLKKLMQKSDAILSTLGAVATELLGPQIDDQARRDMVDGQVQILLSTPLPA